MIRNGFNTNHFLSIVPCVTFLQLHKVSCGTSENWCLVAKLLKLFSTYDGSGYFLPHITFMAIGSAWDLSHTACNHGSQRFACQGFRIGIEMQKPIGRSKYREEGVCIALHVTFIRSWDFMFPVPHEAILDFGKITRGIVKDVVLYIGGKDI